MFFKNSRQSEKLITKARQTWDLKQQYKLAQDALLQDRDNLEAYIILSQHARTLAEAYELYREAVERGKVRFEKELKEDIGYFWRMTETRDFMRVHYLLAIAEWELGNQLDAIDPLWYHLQLNPNDNQGVRTTLLDYLRQVEDEGGIKRLYQLFPWAGELDDIEIGESLLDRSLAWVITNTNIAQSLYNAQVYSLQELYQMPLGDLKKIKGIGASTAAHLQAKAYAYMIRSAHIFSELPSSTQQPMIVLDVRVHSGYKPQRPWGFGLQYPDGRCRYFLVEKDHSLETSVSVELFPSHEHIWQALLAEQQATGLDFMCWGKQIPRHLKATASIDVVETLVLRDLHKLLFQSIAFPLKTLGLKEVSTYLGAKSWLEEPDLGSPEGYYFMWKSKPNLRNLQRTLDAIERRLDATTFIYHWAIKHAEDPLN